MRFRHLTSFRRTEPRDVVRQAAGLWFVDVLEQIDERLRGAAPNVRATFAVWCAEQALTVSCEALPEVHAAREYWRSALAQVWDALQSTRDHPIGDLAAAVLSGTRSMRTASPRASMRCGASLALIQQRHVGRRSAQ